MPFDIPLRASSLHAPRSSVSLSTRRWASTREQESKTAPTIAESANLTEATEEALPAAETNEQFVAQEPAFAPESASVAEAAEQTIAPHRPFRERRGQSDGYRQAEKKNTVYIGNLFFDITESELVKEFTQFGTISRCKIIRDNRGMSKGFAYLEFAELESAESAIKTMNMQLYEGRRMTVQYAARDSSSFEPKHSAEHTMNPPSKTLFVGNMSFEMTDRDLGNLFRGIRNVIDVRVAIDRRTGQPRGFAHADFIDVKSAMEALKVLKDKETYGRKLRVDYSYNASTSPRNQEGSPRSHPTETRATPSDETS
ncbi:uncharacterized protein A1O9_04888 [Exophiala aquamarina CBS 119918]|uniref:RRM domain-containing protein n=1 Tax=Exophiala aquamarina CBS 119918 TaxID=1182545 RepID=A0A072PL12_9EURO|nr:uncharacterized protein A1O9_04888 [Exophiala aquamarina CBS 119918]KEF60038.1 hypothetical protein A1O9_04888 [Exophiala aquamarina CBS 119918]